MVPEIREGRGEKGGFQVLSGPKLHPKEVCFDKIERFGVAVNKSLLGGGLRLRA